MVRLLQQVAAMERITHARPLNSEKFLSSLGDKEKETHLMAEKLLGSSYYMEKTHSYREWLKAHPEEKAGAVPSGPCVIEKIA